MQSKTDIALVEHYGFVYGDKHVPYRVDRVQLDASQSRKISIHVHPDSQVEVRAPQDAKKTDIHDAVMKRARWIVENLQEFSQQRIHVQPRQYISGEMQFYLGRRYVLKVLIAPSKAAKLAHVKMERGNLSVYLTQSASDQPSQVKHLIQQWYKARASAVFQARLEQLAPNFPWLKTLPEYRIVSMSKQWGSCSAKGTLMLNTHLVKAPRECIDYVIVHELCHIKEHNHSERFYRLLTQAMPHWQAVKQQLDDRAELLLNE